MAHAVLVRFHHLPRKAEVSVFFHISIISRAAVYVVKCFSQISPFQPLRFIPAGGRPGLQRLQTVGSLSVHCIRPGMIAAIENLLADVKIYCYCFFFRLNRRHTGCSCGKQQHHNAGQKERETSLYPDIHLCPLLSPCRAELKRIRAAVIEICCIA